MRLLRKRSLRFYLFFMLLLAVTTMSTVAAYADSGTATATVKAGGLTEANTTNRVNLSLANKKNVQIVSYSLPLAVIDARGSGTGWKLMVTSTRFRLMGNNKNKHQLPANASIITGVSASCGTNSTCTGPAKSNSISYPLLVPAGTTPPPPVKFFDATTHSGLGKISIVMMVNVRVPARTESGIYTSTISITIASGP